MRRPRCARRRRRYPRRNYPRPRSERACHETPRRCDMSLNGVPRLGTYRGPRNPACSDARSRHWRKPVLDMSAPRRWKAPHASHPRHRARSVRRVQRQCQRQCRAADQSDRRSRVYTLGSAGGWDSRENHRASAGHKNPKRTSMK